MQARRQVAVVALVQVVTLGLGQATAPAVAGEPAPARSPAAAPLDHRALRLFLRELADDRRALERLRARLVRLEALLAARVLDPRALGELDRKVHQEMLAEARKKRLEVRPGLGELARVASTTSPGSHPFRFFTPRDEARVDLVTAEWVALRDRMAPADLRARRALLTELLELNRLELADDLAAFREKGGEYPPLTNLLAEDAAEEAER